MKVAVTVGVNVCVTVPDPVILEEAVLEPLFVWDEVTVGVGLRLHLVPETVCVEERVAVLLRLAVNEGVSVPVLVAVEKDVGVELIVTVDVLDMVLVIEGVPEGVPVCLDVADCVFDAVLEIVFVIVPLTEILPVCVGVRLVVIEMVERLESVID